MRLQHRSTKAGARTPAKPAAADQQHQQLASAQRRPGPEPRRNPFRVRRAAGPSPLNEGRGQNPGETRTAADVNVGPRIDAQRRPGPEPRRNRQRRPRNRRTRRSLNEGRGQNPGETPWTAGITLPTRIALNEGRGQNPGETRRTGASWSRQEERSTKAGARTPAKPRDPRGRASRSQRSTKAGARTPAKHAGRTRHPRQCFLRSTKAGARTPAKRGQGRVRRAPSSGRSTKAGARTPAKPRRSRSGSRSSSLNEGRGQNPGETPKSDSVVKVGRFHPIVVTQPPLSTH